MFICFVDSFENFTCKILSSVNRVLLLSCKLYNFDFIFFFALLHLLGPLIQCWIKVIKADIFLFCLILGEKHWIFIFNFNVNWLTDVYEWDVHYHSPKRTCYQQCHYNMFKYLLERCRDTRRQWAFSWHRWKAREMSSVLIAWCTFPENSVISFLWSNPSIKPTKTFFKWTTQESALGGWRYIRIMYRRHSQPTCSLSVLIFIQVG